MEEYILEECPICRGAGLLMHEGGWNVQVECADCSAHTVYVEYEDEDEKADAERKVIHLWNIGKVITRLRRSCAAGLPRSASWLPAPSGICCILNCWTVTRKRGTIGSPAGRRTGCATPRGRSTAVSARRYWIRQWD